MSFIVATGHPRLGVEWPMQGRPEGLGSSRRSLYCPPVGPDGGLRGLWALLWGRHPQDLRGLWGFPPSGRRGGQRCFGPKPHPLVLGTPAQAPQGPHGVGDMQIPVLQGFPVKSLSE